MAATAMAVISAWADGYDAQFQAIAAAKGRTADGERLQALFKVEWAYTLSVAPEFATYIGAAGYETKWTDLTAAAIAEHRRLEALQAKVASRAVGALGQLRQVPGAAAGAAGRHSAQLLSLSSRRSYNSSQTQSQRVR